MIYTELNSQLVKAFWQHMISKYGTKVVTKSDSNFMSSVGWALNAMGITDKTKFMKEYSTTIGKTIYTYYEIGGTENKDLLASQISNCVHEHQHVIQYTKNTVSYTFNYVFNKDRRARYEAEAYTCNMELYHWYANSILDPTEVARSLYDYGCNANNVEVAESILKANANTVKYGGIITESGKEAINWLNANAKNVKA